jgi:hypothetical protein
MQTQADDMAVHGLSTIEAKIRILLAVLSCLDMTMACLTCDAVLQCIVCASKQRCRGERFFDRQLATVHSSHSTVYKSQLVEDAHTVYIVLCLPTR